MSLLGIEIHNDGKSSNQPIVDLGPNGSYALSYEAVIQFSENGRRSGSVMGVQVGPLFAGWLDGEGIYAGRLNRQPLLTIEAAGKKTIINGPVPTTNLGDLFNLHGIYSNVVTKLGPIQLHSVAVAIANPETE